MATLMRRTLSRIRQPGILQADPAQRAQQKAEGAAAVEVLPDGTIRIVIAESHGNSEAKPDADEPKHRDFKL